MFAGIDAVSFVTFLDGARLPDCFRLDLLHRESKIEHLIGHSECGGELLTGQLNAPIRIKVIGAAILGNLRDQINIRP